MSDLQNTNFDEFPDFSEQDADALRQNVQPSNTPSPTSGNDVHYTDNEYRDLFEPDTAIPSIEQPTTTPIKNENAENFANNHAVYALNPETSAQPLVTAHIGGLKNESVDPALFSTEDMDAIFGKTTVFDDNFKLDDSYKAENTSTPPWTRDDKHINMHTLASPFKSETKLDYSYMNDMRVTSDAQLQSHPQLVHAQQHVQSHPPRQIRQSQEVFPQYTDASTAEDPQLAVYRIPDGRRRSHTVPPEMRLGMRPPANMGHLHPHPHRQQQTPQPQFNKIMAEHRHRRMTPPPPHMQHHTSAMAVRGFRRGQPVFHRQIEPRARALSPEPKRKRQKVGHLVEAPVRDPVCHLFEAMMGNMEFVVRQGLAGMKYRINDEFERSLADSRLQNSRVTNLSQPLTPMACREQPTFSVPNSGIEIKQADTQIIQSLLTFYEVPFTSTMFLPDKKLLYLRFIGASGTLCHLVLD